MNMVNGFLLEAVKSLYVDIKAAVRMDEEFSESFELDEGVRQGCCLSPLQFTIFISS